MKRDPFARGEYVRKTVVDHYGHCNFCGTHKARMYAYVWSPDDKPIDKRSVDTLLKFCDFQCFEAYSLTAIPDRTGHTAGPCRSSDGRTAIRLPRV